MVATRQATKEEEILGVGRLIKVHGVNEAEFAIVVSDQWQGQGLGTHLLKLLLDIGRQEGLERIIGHILPDNYPDAEGLQEARFCSELRLLRGGYESGILAEAKWKEVIQKGDPYAAEYRLRRSDGSYHWHEAVAITLSLISFLSLFHLYLCPLPIQLGL